MLSFFRHQNQILLPEPPGFTGGPNTFLINLISELKKSDIQWTHDPTSTVQKVFFPISYDIKTLRALKAKGVQIIQRLDGVNYFSKHGKRFIDLNRDISTIYHDLADIIVFQSRYSREQCKEILGPPKAQTELIVNGADTEIFFPSSSIHLNSTIQFITTGNFRNIDMIEPLIAALDKLSIKFKLDVVGPVVNEDLNTFFERPYVNKVGDLTRENVAQKLRQADIFLYSHLNPPCPNSVIEAICTGLPVVGFASGAMAELCDFNKDLLCPVSDHIIQDYKDFDYDQLLKKIQLAVTQFRRFKQRSMEHVNRYSLRKMAWQYFKIFSD